MPPVPNYSKVPAKKKEKEQVPGATITKSTVSPVAPPAATKTNPVASNEVVFRVEDGGKPTFKPRKWVMRFCKPAVIDFYRSCIRIKDTAQ